MDGLGRACQRGTQPVIDDRGRTNGEFRSDLEIERASITVDQASFSDVEGGLRCFDQSQAGGHDALSLPG